MSLATFTFESQYLHSNTQINVILPDKPRDIDAKDYYGSKKKYKVLWLLHGTFGDFTDWQRKSMIELYAREKDLICVMPSGLNANYTSWPNFGIGYDMWNYLTEELMPLVQNWFPASDRREDNFIAGLSMGGTGTIQYAVGFPDKFAAAAVLSWAPYDFRTITDTDSPFGGERQRIMIENAGGMDAYMKSNENIWDKLPDFNKLSVKPKLYFTMGKNDFLYDTYVKFKAYAEEINLDATFEEFDDYQHEWRFWDMAIQRALIFFGLGDADLGKLF